MVKNGLELIERCEAEKPDLALADISMPVMNGLDALREITRRGLRTKVIIVTGSADVGLATDAFRAGAAGFVLKHAASDELLTALRGSIQRANLHHAPHRKRRATPPDGGSRRRWIGRSDRA